MKLLLGGRPLGPPDQEVPQGLGDRARSPAWRSRSFRKYCRAAQLTRGASRMVERIVGMAIKPKAMSRKLITPLILTTAETTIMRR